MIHRLVFLLVLVACAHTSTTIITALSPSSSNKATSSSRRTFVRNLGAFVGGVAATSIATQDQLLRPEIANAASIPPTGAKAPEFELPNSRRDGTTTLQSLIKDGKKWTVLYFYPAAFTSGCTMEARSFQRDIDQYRKLNAQIVGVSVDPPEKNAEFCTSEGLDFYMLSDQGGQVSKLYGSALSVPGFGSFSNRQTYVIDPKGYLRWVFTDVESRIPRHSAEVLEKLEELQQTATA